MSDIEKAVVRYVATDLDPIMVPDPIGAWVRVEDYQAKADRIKELEAKLTSEIDECDDIIKHDRTRIEELVSMVNGRDDRIEELEAENETLRSMVADVINDTGDDPEIMAASRAEWAARAFAAEAKLANATEALVITDKWLRELDMYASPDYHLVPSLQQVRTTLAELKGEK